MPTCMRVMGVPLRKVMTRRFCDTNPGMLRGMDTSPAMLWEASYPCLVSKCRLEMMQPADAIAWNRVDDCRLVNATTLPAPN